MEERLSQYENDEINLNNAIRQAVPIVLYLWILYALIII